MDGLPPDLSNQRYRKVTRLDSTEVCLDADMIRLLIAIDDRKPLEQIAAEVGMASSTLTATVSKLLELNLIEAVQKNRQFLDDRFITKLKLNLSRAVGPMAEILIEDVVEDLNLTVNEIPKSQVAELISALAFEIPDEDSRIQFKKEMLKVLKQI
jgi:DNA-binding MarR family transcriptional regulator